MSNIVTKYTLKNLKGGKHRSEVKIKGGRPGPTAQWV